MAELALSPGKYPGLAEALGEMSEAWDSLPAEQQLELRRVCLQQVLEQGLPKALGPAEWHRCSIGGSSVVKVSEPAGVPK